MEEAGVVKGCQWRQVGPGKAGGDRWTKLKAPQNHASHYPVHSSFIIIVLRTLH